MAVVLLKNLSNRVNIKEQQNSILTYASKNNISIASTEIETSDSTLTLEDRGELKGFLRSLNENSTLIVYDFWVLSIQVDELVKILECLLTRNISLHVVSKKEVIRISTTSLEVLEILANERKATSEKKSTKGRGRPAGRMSRSKFDEYRSEVVTMLEEGYSVSKIAVHLKVSRTSLKDYINSRNLKILAQTKKELLGKIPKNFPKKGVRKKKCDLIEEQNIKQGA